VRLVELFGQGGVVRLCRSQVRPGRLGCRQRRVQLRPHRRRRRQRRIQLRLLLLGGRAQGREGVGVLLLQGVELGLVPLLGLAQRLLDHPVELGRGDPARLVLEALEFGLEVGDLRERRGGWVSE